MVLIITGLKSYSGVEKKLCMFEFLAWYFITTVSVEVISGLANLSLPLKERYSLKIKQQHKQMNYEEIFMACGGERGGKWENKR